MISLKNKLNSKHIIKIMGCHNALGAKIAEEVGFDALWFSGFEFATSNCLPDANILSMTENAQAIKTITKSSNIPLIADCDTGYGDLNNVIHMVKEYEKIGVSAVCIEDKNFPKINSLCNSHNSLISAEEFSEKIVAAKDARKSHEFLIIARIESLTSGMDVNDAIIRAHMYSKIGADLIVIHSKANDIQEIKNFCNLYQEDTPLVIIPTTYYKTSIDTVHKISNKIRMIIYANHGIRTIIKSLKNNYQNILESGSTECIEEQIVTVNQAFQYQKIEEHIKNYNFYKNAVQKFLHEKY